MESAQIIEDPPRAISNHYVFLNSRESILEDPQSQAWFFIWHWIYQYLDSGTQCTVFIYDWSAEMHGLNVDPAQSGLELGTSRSQSLPLDHDAVEESAELMLDYMNTNQMKKKVEPLNFNLLNTKVIFNLCGVLGKD